MASDHGTAVGAGEKVWRKSELGSWLPLSTNKPLVISTYCSVCACESFRHAVKNAREYEACSVKDELDFVFLWSTTQDA